MSPRIITFAVVLIASTAVYPHSLPLSMAVNQSPLQRTVTPSPIPTPTPGCGIEIPPPSFSVSTDRGEFHGGEVATIRLNKMSFRVFYLGLHLRSTVDSELVKTWSFGAGADLDSVSIVMPMGSGDWILGASAEGDGVACINGAIIHGRASLSSKEVGLKVTSGRIIYLPHHTADQ